MIGRIVKMNVEVTSDEEFEGCSSSEEKKELNYSRTTQKFLETADDNGGR